MTDTDVRSQVRQYLARHTNRTDLEDSLDVFKAGLVSSLFAMQLVVWVERTFARPVATEELDITNFGTVDSIVAFVERGAPR
ncbi:phosphopantetheine-binding protein [Streptomyces sp. NPDC006435]|uniref:acyl carrier protein n=1 Tax=Streptomyces sp. NPDC006435 TaxID=3154300 RepID=UPI0033AD6C5D